MTVILIDEGVYDKVVNDKALCAALRKESEAENLKVWVSSRMSDKPDWMSTLFVPMPTAESYIQAMHGHPVSCVVTDDEVLYRELEAVVNSGKHHVPVITSEELRESYLEVIDEDDVPELPVAMNEALIEDLRDLPELTKVAGYGGAPEIYDLPDEAMMQVHDETIVAVEIDRDYSSADEYNEKMQELNSHDD